MRFYNQPVIPVGVTNKATTTTSGGGGGAQPSSCEAIIVAFVEATYTFRWSRRGSYILDAQQDVSQHDTYYAETI